LARTLRPAAILAASTLLIIATAAPVAAADAPLDCITGDSPVDQITIAWRTTCTHPLCGFVHQPDKPLPADRAACRHDSWRALLERMHIVNEAGGIAVMGEIHDNSDHHRLRAILLEGFRAAAFEQVRADQQPLLDAHNTATPKATGAAPLLTTLAWDATAWSKTADYRPLFDAVVAAGLPIYAADPTRETMRKAAKEGLAAALPDDTDRTRLALDKPLGDAQDAASLAEIEASHCGMIPKAAHAGMAAAQRYRDAHMADVVMRASQEHGSAILFAGNGHARTDRGVPWYIQARARGTPVVAVALVEVEEGRTDPQSYVPVAPDGKPAADFIIFTPPSPGRDADPCEKMRRPAAK
jgi:uncharacterized iron-regulated protein